MKRLDLVRSLGVTMIAVMAMTLVTLTPVAAADVEECRGGGPSYWLENPWPTPFYVPKFFQNPNKNQRTLVRGWTRFDDVFRWRHGKDQEGMIFAKTYTLRKALNGRGTLLKSVAKHTVAALLNAGEPNNDFPWPTNAVIKRFQVYWDGTDDMTVQQARRTLRRDMRGLNAQACPPPVAP